MKIKRIMTKNAGFCRTDEMLAKALEIMWQKDCGIVPVVDKKRRVVGTVTDRDAAVASFLQNKPVGEIRVGEIISGEVLTCAADDKVEKVLKQMKKHQLRRVPVVKSNGRLDGIISITDILLAAGTKRSLQRQILKTLESIGRPRAIVLTVVEE